MSASGEILALGGAGKIYQPDAMFAYASSAEPNQVPVLETDINYPAGPSGDVVFRRIYVTIEWQNGVHVTLTPRIDGVLQTQFQRTFIRTGSGRDTFMLALVKRGSGVSVLAVGAPPTGAWWMEQQIDVHYMPATRSKAGSQ